MLKDLKNYWDNVEDNRRIGTEYMIGIAGGASQTVLFNPLSGSLDQRKYLPITCMPLAIELSLVDDSNEPMATVIQNWQK